MPHFNTEHELDELLNGLYDYSNLSETELEMRTDYSGRGMYGKTCVGFVVDNPILFAMSLTSYLIEQSDYEDNAYPQWYNLNIRTDSMGRSSIIYFPNWECRD